MVRVWINIQQLLAILRL